MNRKPTWNHIDSTSMELSGDLGWINKPINTNEYLLVSWRMAGSEFVRESILENFTYVVGNKKWGKTHAILDDEIADILIESGTKVIMVISDPREIATNVKFFDNGLHFIDTDYHSDTNLGFTTIDQIAEKQINLMNFFKNKFKKNCLIVRYEDAVFFREKFLNKVSSFLDCTPLYKDNVEKYKKSSFKNVGHFQQFFPNSILKRHRKKFIDFYEEWDYPVNGLAQLKYKWCVKGI